MENMDNEQLVEAVQRGDTLMVEIPEERLAADLDLCLELVRINGSNLRFVPESVRTLEFDRTAALSSCWAFGYLHEQDKTEELLLAVIESREADTDPAMLGEEWAVPDELLTPAVAAAARARYGDARVRKWAGKRSPLFA